MKRRSLFKKLGAAAAVVAVAPALVTEAAEDTRVVVLDAEPRIEVDTHTYVAWAEAEPPTFEELAAECEANGCNVERQYIVVRLRYEYAHWRDGEQWADDTMTTSDRDLEPVAAWLDGLHEREARQSEEWGRVSLQDRLEQLDQERQQARAMADAWMSTPEGERRLVLDALAYTGVLEQDRERAADALLERDDYRRMLREARDGAREAQA